MEGSRGQVAVAVTHVCCRRRMLPPAGWNGFACWLGSRVQVEGTKGWLQMVGSAHAGGILQKPLATLLSSDFGTALVLAWQFESTAVCSRAFARLVVPLLDTARCRVCHPAACWFRLALTSVTITSVMTGRFQCLTCAACILHASSSRLAAGGWWHAGFSLNCSTAYIGMQVVGGVNCQRTSHWRVYQQACCMQ
jgi:hypothetical protein